MKTGTSVHKRPTVKWNRHNTLGKTAGNTREPGLSVQPSGTDGKHVRHWTSTDYKDRRLRAGGDRAGRQWRHREDERKCVQIGKESTGKCKKSRQKSCSKCVTCRENIPSPVGAHMVPPLKQPYGEALTLAASECGLVEEEGS